MNLSHDPTALPASGPNLPWDRAFDQIVNKRNSVFVAGRAGTGKSFLLGICKERLASAAVVLAPTGLAALNVDGETVHRYFGFQPVFIDSDQITPSARPDKFRRVETIIIDEVSMVRADLLDGIDRSLRVNRADTRPFGGVQIVLFGDPLQLPPVVSDGILRSYMHRKYSGAHFFDAKVFDEWKCTCIELETVYRQHEAPFLDALASIRTGIKVEGALGLLNSRVGCVSLGETEVMLTATNAQADQINADCLSRLPGECRVYHASVGGEWDPQTTPADLELTLKVGAKVILTRNDPAGRWVNGTVGVVQEMLPGSVRVAIERRCFEVLPAQWENFGYDDDAEQNKLVRFSRGSFKQIPLRVAYALTIHRSQGQSLERVCVDMGTGAFESGQTYVALSRCRTLSGLRLTRALSEHDVLVDRRALAYATKFGGVESKATVIAARNPEVEQPIRNGPDSISGTRHSSGSEAPLANEWKKIKVAAEAAKKRMVFDANEGLEMFCELLSAHPEDPMVFFSRAEAFQMRGDLSAAEADLQRAVRLFPMPKWRERASQALAQVQRQLQSQRAVRRPGSSYTGEQPTS